VAEDFETCSKHPDFLKLSANQLARILRRRDLVVSREEAVVKAIFSWIKVSKDRHAFLGMLLQNVDLQSLSMENLLHLGRATLCGPSGDDLLREVDDALTSRKRTRSPSTVQPKRRRLQHWSPFLGASAASIEASGQEVLTLPNAFVCMRWHKGEIYASDHFRSTTSIFSWKPGDPAICLPCVAGEGAAVTGINDLGSSCHMSVSPSGEVFVSDVKNRRILRFQNGSGDLVVGNTDAQAICCSPNGVLYVVSQRRTVQKLVGSTLETVIASENLPAAKQFETKRVFVTTEEVIYLSDNLNENHRILCINPGESLEPVVVGQIQTEGRSFLTDLFVTESGAIYVSDTGQRKVLALHPRSTTFTEVLKCPDGLLPVALFVQDRSLYVSMVTLEVNGQRSGKVYEYVLPPDLQLNS
jgi:hypothetical protein